MAFDSQKRILAVLNTRSMLLLDGSTGTQAGRDRLASPPPTRASHSAPATANCGPARPRRNGPDSILIVADLRTGNARRDQPHRAERPSGARGHRLFARRQDRVRGVQPQQHAGRDRRRPRTRSSRRSKSAWRRSAWRCPRTGRIFVTNRGGRAPVPDDTVAPSSGSEVVTDPVTGSSATGTLSVVDAEDAGGAAKWPWASAPSQLTLSPDEKTAGRGQRPFRFGLASWIPPRWPRRT